MDFYCQEVGVVRNCPECDGKGRKPYPYNFYPCHRCEGYGRVIDVMMTYPESYDSGFRPMGKMIFAGITERPYDPYKRERVY
jgi:DnaJ-class molecular chaperone